MSAVAATRQPVFAVAIILLLTVLVYAPVAGFGFVNHDDPTYILLNPHVQDGLTLKSVTWSFTALYFSNWHPLTWLSYLADISMFGIDPRPMHVMSLAIHVVNTLLLAYAFTRMTRNIWPSLAVAAAFALHPLHVESVAWISERKDVLSALFWMLALIAYARYAEHKRATDYIWTVLAFTAGLMAKPMVITLPCVLLLLDYWPLRRSEPWPRLIAEKIPLFVLSLASGVVTMIAQHRGGAIGSVDELSMPYRAANALAAYGAYLGKTLWPAPLSPFYPHPGAGIALWKPIVALMTIAVITVLAWLGRRSRPYVLVGWLWFLGTLVPVIGLVQVGSQAMADRYTYIPLIGLFVVIAWIGYDLAQVRPNMVIVVRGATACAVAGMAIATAMYVPVWRDSISLFEHALAVTPRNSAVHTNLGVALAEAGRFDEAIPHFETVAALQPNSARTQYNLALAHEHLGDSAAAVRHYQRCLELDPAYADAANNLGMLKMAEGELESARALFAKAIEARPGHVMAHINLGDLFASQGAWNKASDAYQRALEHAPNLPLALVRLARAYAAQGQVNEARNVLEQCLRANPEYAEAKKRLAELEQQGKAGE